MKENQQETQSIENNVILVAELASFSKFCSFMNIVTFNYNKVVEYACDLTLFVWI